MSNSTDPGELKAALRQKLRAEAKRFSSAERVAASAQVCQRLKEQIVWRQAQSVLCYFPMPDEPDIHPLHAAALAEGKALTLPRYCAGERQYVACQVRDLGSDLQPGTFGIHEPAASCPIFDPKKLDLVLVPGVGFTLSGLRLGRGRGYYDRLLAQIPRFKCGVAFDWQVSVEIPAEPHDIRLDGILTPTRWQGFAGQGRF